MPSATTAPWTKHFAWTAGAPSDSSFRSFFYKVDVAALCAAIRDWTIAQTPCGAKDLAQLVCNGKTLRSSINPRLVVARRSLPRSRFMRPLWAWRTASEKPDGYSQACDATTGNHERAVLWQLQEQGANVLLPVNPQASPKE